MIFDILILHPLIPTPMSIVLTILAGVFSFLFLKGLYDHIDILLTWRKARRSIQANPNLSEEEKQELIEFIRTVIKQEGGTELP
jgi:hypothetical protein